MAFRKLMFSGLEPTDKLDGISNSSDSFAVNRRDDDFISTEQIPTKSEYEQHYNGYNLLWLSVEEVIRLARQVHWEERLQQLKCNHHLE